MSVLLLGVLASMVATVVVALILFLFYSNSARSLKRNRTFAQDLWWLPKWQCWRFVIRNMKGDACLYDVEFRSWLREIEPADVDSSVSSFRDFALENGRRVLLPQGQDLPILCFRLERKDAALQVTKTDKFGTAAQSFPITTGLDYELKAEYAFTLTPPSQVAHRVRRLLTIPGSLEREGRRLSLFSYLEARQSRTEASVAVVFTEDEQISLRFEG